MSQPPPPPGNPPRSGTPEGAEPPPQGPQDGPPVPPPGQVAQPVPPPSGYGSPAHTPPPVADNPYAGPVPPGQNPYAAPPAQPPYPQGQFPQGQFPQGHFPQGPFPQGPQPPVPPPPGQFGRQAPGTPSFGQPQGVPVPVPVPAPGQQPWGYGYGYQQPPPAGRGGGRLIVIVAAVVVALLVVGGGVFLTTRGGGSDSKPQTQGDAGGTGGTSTAQEHRTEFSLLWSKQADAVADEENLKETVGLWFTDKYAVKNEIGKVVGYDQATGAQAWSIPTPSRGDCTAARDAHDNVAAVQYGAKCEKVMAIDMAAGRTLWTVDLPGGSGSTLDFEYSEMAISGDTVGVDWLEGSIGYRLSDHKELWRSGDGDCEDDGYAGGKQFVAIVNCGYKTYKVQVIDPAKNGVAKWSWTAPVGTKVSAVVSTDPVVVVLGTAGSTYTDVATIADGRLRSRISLGTDKYDINDDGTEMQAVHNVLVDSTSVYLTLRGKSDGSGNLLSGIVAFDIADGKQKWVAKPSGKNGIGGLGFQDGKVLALEPPDYDERGKLVTLDPGTGAISPYATLPKNAYEKIAGAGLHDYSVWQGGRLYYTSRTIFSLSDLDWKQQYLVAFG